MTWFKVHSGKIKTHRKFRSLDNAALGAWIRIRAEVDLLEGEPLPDREYADDLAQGDADAVALLIAVGLLDVGEDGSIAIHDLDDWGRNGDHVKPSDTAEARTERSRRFRERQRLIAEGLDPDGDATPATPSVGTPATAGTPATTEEKRVEEKRREEIRPEARAREVWELSENDPVVVYGRLTGKFASDDARDWINQLSKNHGDEAVTEVMLAEWGRDQTKRDLLGRVERVLKERAYAATQRDRQAAAHAIERVTVAHDEQIARMRAADPEADAKAAAARRAIREGLAATGLVAPVNSLAQPMQNVPLAGTPAVDSSIEDPNADDTGTPNSDDTDQPTTADADAGRRDAEPARSGAGRRSRDAADQPAADPHAGPLTVTAGPPLVLAAGPP